VTDIVPATIYDQPRIVAVIVVPKPIVIEIGAVPVRDANVYPPEACNACRPWGRRMSVTRKKLAPQ
jgi:hypothetical protein